MYIGSHRGGCCGINELKRIIPGDLARGPYPWMRENNGYQRKMQYRAHCSHRNREWMEPELLAAGFTPLATNATETVWGKVG